MTSVVGPRITATTPLPTPQKLQGDMTLLKEEMQRLQLAATLVRSRAGLAREAVEAEQKAARMEAEVAEMERREKPVAILVGEILQERKLVPKQLMREWDSNGDVGCGNSNPLGAVLGGGCSMAP